MNPKLLFVSAILAGLLAVALVQVQLSKDRGEAVKVFRVIDDIEVGQKIGQRFEVVALPSNHFPNLLKEAPTEEMESFVSGTTVRQEILEGELVLYRHLEGAGSPGVRALIPEGKVAVSLEVDETTSVSYLVQPGDVVDVWSIDTAAGDGVGESVKIGPLLKGVGVLAVGRRYQREARGARGRRPYSTVTLVVSENEAKNLIRARDVELRPMTLVLRPPEKGDELVDEP